MQLIRNLTWVLLGTVATFTVAAPPLPPTIVTQGKGAAIACASCHGMEGAGNSQAGYPALAQMPPAYFTKQIVDFNAGTRTNSIMTPIAKALSLEDAQAAASFYAGLPRPQSPSAPADAGVVARGENLALNGAWDRGLPACIKCHGAGGMGVAPSFPPLAGQHVGYTVSQLQAWKTGARTNDPLSLMKTVAEKLGDDDMRAVAAYLATLGKHATPPQTQPTPTPVTQTPATLPASTKTPTPPAGKTPLTQTPAAKKSGTQEKTK